MAPQPIQTRNRERFILSLSVLWVQANWEVNIPCGLTPIPAVRNGNRNYYMPRLCDMLILKQTRLIDSFTPDNSLLIVPAFQIFEMNPLALDTFYASSLYGTNPVSRPEDQQAFTGRVTCSVPFRKCSPIHTSNNDDLSVYSSFSRLMFRHGGQPRARSDRLCRRSLDRIAS
jgi:hypothetical protein